MYPTRTYKNRAVRVIPGSCAVGCLLFSLRVHISGVLRPGQDHHRQVPSRLAFGRPLFHGGLINRRAVLKASYAQLVYLVAGADEDQMTRIRDSIAALCAGGTSAGAGHRDGDAARRRGSADIRGGCSTHRRTPGEGPGRGDRVEQRRGGGRPDRRDAGHGPCDRHPDGDGGRPLHR